MNQIGPEWQRWVEAGKILAADPRAQVLCPRNGDGYLEVTDIPVPGDPSQVEPLTGGRWDFWIVVIVATLGNTVGSVIGYAIGAWGGRPFLERYGKYLLIRPHELELIAATA